MCRRENFGKSIKHVAGNNHAGGKVSKNSINMYYTMVVLEKICSKTPKDINFASISLLLVPMALKWIKEYIKIKKVR